MLRRTRGFDVPDMLAAGPRDVLVPASGASAAREVLLEAELLDERAAAARSSARGACSACSARGRARRARGLGRTSSSLGGPAAERAPPDR